VRSIQQLLRTAGSRHILHANEFDQSLEQQTTDSLYCKDVRHKVNKTLTLNIKFHDNPSSGTALSLAGRHDKPKSLFEILRMCLIMVKLCTG
jgi:hypothetical protein